MKKFRFVDTGYQSPYMNMAIDEALLISKKPVLRVYRWRPATLSLGYFQSYKAINLKKLKKLKVGFVRRPTGGNAILHDKELTYSFIINKKELPESVVESYKIISNGILLAFNKLGLKGKMNKKIKKLNKSAVCFNDPSHYEIIIKNKKIVGSAQTRKKGKILQHGSILLDIDFEKMCSLFSDYSPNLVSKVANRVTAINLNLKNKINYKTMANALKKGFEENFNIKFINDALNNKELLLAKKLEKEKYATKEWNFRI